MIRHAGLVALRIGGSWCGALIEGPSGVGKSDLALRVLNQGFRLVADDRAVVWASGGRLYGRAPGPLAGLIEVRGQGVVRESALDLARVVLLATCVADSAAIERMPEPRIEMIAEIAVPRLELNPREPSAPAKLRRALEHLGADRQQAYLAGSLGGPNGRAGTGDTA
jgi:serine kinase of HPr protein (carbohydrate metabolism regulator)